jgi:hypothetical protein
MLRQQQALVWDLRVQSMCDPGIFAENDNENREKVVVIRLLGMQRRIISGGDYLDRSDWREFLRVSGLAAR